MIPIKKEEAIRRLIHKGHTNNHIALVTDAGHSTVSKIRKSVALTEMYSVDVRERVIFLLIGGFPMNAVAAKLKLPVEAVMAMHRYSYLHALRSNLKGIASICMVCRRDIEATCEATPEGWKHEIDISRLIPHAESLHEIACHVQSLDDLGVIASPLFCGIASLARETLEKINDTEEKASSSLRTGQGDSQH